MSDRHEVIGVIERLQSEFADLTVRGLRAVGPSRLASLEALRDELARINADHLAGRIGALIEAIRNDDLGSGRALLRAQTSLGLFERMLTREVVTGALETLTESIVDAPAGEEDEV